LEEELAVAQSMNDMLNLQLAEKKQDVEMLESRLKSQAFTKENRMSRNIMADDFKTDQMKVENEMLKNDVIDAKSKLGQQLTTISKLEVLLGGCYEKIETLETDKARFSQKLALFESIKSDYETQKEKYSKYEKKILEMQQAITAQNTELSTKDDFIEAFENEVASLNDAMDLFMNERDEFQKEFNRLFIEVRSVHFQLIEKTATTTDPTTVELKDKVNDANLFLKEIKANINAKRLKIGSFESSKAKEESKGMGTKSNSKLKEVEEDSVTKVWALVKQLEAEKAAWTKEKNISTALKESLDKQIASLKEKIQADEKTILDLQIENEALHETSENYKNSLERTKKMEMALSEYQNAVKLLQEDLVGLETERDQWEQREQGLLAMNTKFEVSLRKEMKEVENLLNGEISELKIKLLSAQMAGDNNAADGNTEQNHNGLLIEIEKYKSEIVSLNTHISELEKMKDELENAVEYQGGIAEDALQQIDEYEKELLSLRSETQKEPMPGQKTFPGRIEELQNENEDLIFHNEELIDKNEKLQAVIALLKDS
jgi:chromosome segregation ATPase